MSSSALDNPDILSINGQRLNPAEFKIDLLCQGARIDDTCRIETEGRPMRSNRRDLASGLELILPGEMKELWVNVPVREKFVETSPYRLSRVQSGYRLFDERRESTYNVILAPRPDWYDVSTTRGIPMAEIGMLQGTCLVIDLDGELSGEETGGLPRTLSHAGEPRSAHTEAKTVEDVVETAVMARKQSGVTVVLLRGEHPAAGGLTGAFPFLKALKQEVGILVSMQFPPEKDSGIYDQARTLGADHLSFRLGFFSKEHFSLLSPGWAQILGQESFFRALEYCARRMGKGRVSGEMIAGLEPVGDSLRAVDYLVRIGALPLLSIFRHVQGAAMEHFPAPDLQNMLVIFRQVYESCRTRNLPIGMVPNLHLSMLLHPEDTLYLAPDSADAHTYSRWILTMKQVMRPYFLRRMRRQSTSQA